VSISKKIQSFWADQSGATMVEYGLLVALLTAVVMFAMARFGVVNAETFEILAEAFSGAS
jgi:Flp pilus assembly pilin Flp